MINQLLLNPNIFVTYKLFFHSHAFLGIISKGFPKSNTLTLSITHTRLKNKNSRFGFLNTQSWKRSEQGFNLAFVNIMVSKIPWGFGDVSPCSNLKAQAPTRKNPEQFATAVKGTRSVTMSFPPTVCIWQNEVAFSFRSGAEMIFCLNFLSDPDLFQCVINPYSQLLFCQMISHLLNYQKLVDFTLLPSGWCS